MDIKDRLWGLVIDYWHRPITIFGVILFTILSLFSLFTDIDINQISINEIILVLLILIILILSWYYTTKIPKSKKDKIGFVIALTSESEEEKRIIYNDLIKAVREILTNTQDLLKFDFIELPKWYSDSIKDNDDARKYLKKCKAHFLLYGEANVRKVKGKESHSIRIKQVVVHRPITMELSGLLSKEINKVFPGNISINREHELYGLEISSLWLSESVKYFISLAAFVSGDFRLAQSLLENIKRSRTLVKLKSKFPGIRKLKKLIPLRLADVFLAKAKLAYQQWRKTRNINYLVIMNDEIENHKKYNPKSYEYHLLKAIYFFVVNRDITNAKEILYKCKTFSDPTWRYSLAFLYAYTGKMEKAIWYYDKAFERPIDHNLPFEIEEFISWLIEEEPDKYQLHFCLGLINLKAKGDVQAAKKDFKNFLGMSKDGEFQETLDQAREYIAEIDSGMHEGK
jgi:hypothetical protein